MPVSGIVRHRAALHRCARGFGLLAGVTFMISNAWAFDQASFKSKLDGAKADIASDSPASIDPALAKISEMIQLGEVGTREFGQKKPEYAKLMNAVAADAAAMKNYTDAEIEDKWGEQGSAGDAVGVPLKSLPQSGDARAAMELVIGPAHAYILVKKWSVEHKSRWRDQAQDELDELSKHLTELH